LAKIVIISVDLPAPFAPIMRHDIAFATSTSTP